MYYDASGTDYISTPSFAIPDTGILTIEAWMKSVINASPQLIIGEGDYNATIGFIFIFREGGSNSLKYRYASGGS
jgi:hypothetical protein